jgi:lysyl-tRNA synthetase class 2
MTTMSATPQDSSAGGADLVADRRRKLARLRDEMGIDPYGRRMDGLVSIANARAAYDPAADEAFKADGSKDNRPAARIAGRIVLHRDSGKLVFMKLRDASGDLQVAVSKAAVDEQSFKLAKLADLGDIAVASGRMGTTKTGEVTLWATRSEDAAATTDDIPAFTIATKSLAPPPEKFHGLSDSELRYRKRYVDLYANPEVMQLAQLRCRIVEEIRAYLRRRGFLEVETPMLQPIHGGAAARPFVTHHNALDTRLYLRIAPELYLKRLLVGGMPRVFEVNRNFRNEGVSPRHNPEFTMLEAYEAFGNWETMADLVEDMVCTVAMNVLGTLKIEHKNDAGEVTRTINLHRPWRRVSMAELVEERTGWKFDQQPLNAYQHKMLRAANRGKDLKLAGSPAEQLVEVYEKLIEPTLIDPTFVTRVPSVCIPLARECRDDPFFADVYELAINGVEISPGYTELNDPEVQEQHFRGQVGDREEQQQVDEDFLEALRVGMPPAGGMGLGIDRLVMMLTGATSIRDVILFPLMKPL